MPSLQSETQLDMTLSALADPTRRAILAQLASGERTVTELAAPFDLWVPAQDNYYVVIANRDQASPAALAFRDWLFEQV